MSLPVLRVDLGRTPEARWDVLLGHEVAMRELVDTYARDLGGLEAYRDALALYRDEVISEENRREIDAVAAIAGLDPLEILLVNAYYDVFKHVMGCTAFAADTPDGPIHARNLDWWSENGALEKHSVVIRYHRGGEPVFDAVTWPGFIGTLSGVAPGRFSVTLNAVLSDDAPGIATPVGLVLRELLTSATYEEACASLATRRLACDGLFLVVGTRESEMCVIERTPTLAATRGPEAGRLVVTNDYRALAAPGWRPNENALTETSCRRFDLASARARGDAPTDTTSCLSILDDAGVRMGITVQQMVFCASRGLTFARRPV